MVEPSDAKPSFTLPWWAYALIAFVILGVIAAIVYSVQKSRSASAGKLIEQLRDGRRDSLSPKEFAKIESMLTKEGSPELVDVYSPYVR